MKKLLLLALVAMGTLCACNGEREYLDYQGLSMGMSAKAMCDSLIARGYELDTNHTTESDYVLISQVKNNRVDIYQQKDSITDILESYEATYNDSTRLLWQSMRDELEQTLARPFLTHHADLHKEAVFQTSKGTLTLTLLNTYTPTLTVHYSKDVVE